MNTYVIKDRASCQNWAISVSDDLAITIEETDLPYSAEPVIADSLNDGVYYTVFVNDGSLGLEVYDAVTYGEVNNVIELYNAAAGRNFILVVRDATLALVVGNVVMSSTIDLTTLSRVKSFLTITDSNDDEALQSILSSVSQYVATYCNRKFILDTYTEYLNGDGQDTIVLSNIPVVSVASLYDDTGRTYSPDTLIPASEFVWWDTGIIELDTAATFAVGKKNIKVVYTAGYNATNIPFDLQLAVWRIVQFIYKDSKTSIAGPDQLDVAGMIVKFRNSEVREILDRYRRIPTR